MMASGRMLRTQISLSPQVNDLSLKATLLFTWLIPHVDDFGRIYADPRRLKAIIFPMRNDISINDIKTALLEIEKSELIKLYKIENNLYLQLTKFEQHQSGLHKRTQSKIPPPEAAILLDSGKFREIPGNSVLNRTGTEQEQELERTLMSGKPDDDLFFDHKTEQKEECTILKTNAIEVLEFLNSKTGRNYRPVGTNLKLIMNRLKSGATVQNCKSVIAKKYREWKSDEKLEIYLRPKTLFNATNFEQYFGELIQIEDNQDEH